MRRRPKGRRPQEKRLSESSASRQEGRRKGRREGRTERGRGSRPSGGAIGGRPGCSAPARRTPRPVSAAGRCGCSRAPGRGPLGGVPGLVLRRDYVPSAPDQRLQGALGDLGRCQASGGTSQPLPRRGRLRALGALQQWSWKGHGLRLLTTIGAWMSSGVAPL